MNGSRPCTCLYHSPKMMQMLDNSMALIKTGAQRFEDESIRRVVRIRYFRTCLGDTGVLLLTYPYVSTSIVAGDFSYTTDGPGHEPERHAWRRLPRLAVPARRFADRARAHSPPSLLE